LGIAATCFIACNPKEEKPAGEAHLLRDTIAVPIAAKYVANYGAHAGTVETITIDSTGKRVVVETSDTRAVWFSLEQLRAFVKNLETEKGDGVRFYFATYDKSYPAVAGVPKPEYWGHNTLVLVSTKKVTLGDKVIHQDYFTPTDGFKPKGFILGNPPENRGEMCPPPVHCDSVGAALIEPETKK